MSDAPLRTDSTVLSHRPAGAGCRMLVLRAPEIAAAAAPGRFVHLRVPALEASALRRPFSICDADPATGSLSILYKEVGRGTAAMAALAPGDRVDLMGPLGRGFPLPPPDADVLLVGGGYGVAPLHFLAKVLSSTPRTGRIVLFAGGRTAADLLLLGGFRALGVEIRPATDDGSLGDRGLVTAPLDAFLEDAGPAARRAVLFACGPFPMLRALDERAAARGFAAWLSLDRRMACGVGACCGCAQKVRDPDGAVRVATVCGDGPVFPAGSVVWD
ncbi:MAG: dihydroorotate dehydrogenase electron transfer subunit [Kiritimatiellae bacterium]|nr:dihydroorotate dehydrogenase electron transfer subunit [Kiritimatiellia bacterium]